MPQPSTLDAAPATAAKLTSGRWLFWTLVLLVLAVAAELALAWRLDVFGVLRDPTGRALITSSHERQAKYLLNQEYVPDNFNALIVGASASVNWRPQRLTGYRFYDESLEGGNATEQRKLVELALKHGHFQVALVGIFPRITGSHELQDGLDQVNRAEAFGSLAAFNIEVQLLLNKLRHRTSTFYPDGSHEMPSTTPEPPKAKMNMKQDPQAIEDYRALVEELQAHGVRVIYVVYPVYTPAFDFNRDALLAFRASLPATLPTAPILDLNAPEYKGFRDDPANYIDEIHLSRTGADKLTDIINTRMHELLAGPLSQQIQEQR